WVWALCLFVVMILVASGLILQFPFVNHIGKFVSRVQLHLLVELRDEAHAVVLSQEWLTFELTWKDKLRSHSVLGRRAVLHQKHFLSVFALEKHILLQCFSRGSSKSSR